MFLILRVAVLLLLGLGAAQAQGQTPPPTQTQARAPANPPIRSIAPTRLLVSGPMGWGTLPIYVDPDWVQPQPEITRVVIMLHDNGRDAAWFARLARKARTAAGSVGQDTMLVVPHLLAPVDLLAHNLPGASILRWQIGEWASGAAAHGPSLLPSYAALDAVLERLASLRLFPNLRDVVLAGHSAGGQAVQLYAAAGRGQAALQEREIKVRYVVASPSFYLYFRPERPESVDAAACPSHDAWPYGILAPPTYVADPAKLEARYASRDVVYLLGTADNDEAATGLDKSCAAMAQGPHRLARGLAMDAMMRKYHGAELGHRVLQVPGIGHDAEALFASPCGVAALFDTAGCDATRQ